MGKAVDSFERGYYYTYELMERPTKVNRESRRFLVRIDYTERQDYLSIRMDKIKLSYNLHFLAAQFCPFG